MNSLTSLISDELIENQFCLKRSTLKRINQISMSPQKQLSQLEQYVQPRAKTNKNTRQQQTYSSGFRISSKHYTHFPPVKGGSVAQRERIKCSSQCNSALFQQKIQQNHKLVQNEQDEGKQLQELLRQRDEVLVTPRKIVLRKQKFSRQQKQDNDIKLQSNLRIQSSNFNQDVDMLMGYYNRKMKLGHNTKVFIYNSQDDYIKRVLLSWGWIENKILDSPFYHLKWTYLDTLNDHKTVPGQILNHFKNNQQLTSKGGLMKNMRNYNYNGFDLKLHQFVPRSYDLGNSLDWDCFCFQYQRTTMMAILKKHYKFILQKVDNSIVAQLTKTIQQRKQREKSRWRKKKYGKQIMSPNRNDRTQYRKYQDFQNPRADFKMNISILIICIRYYRYQMKITQDEDWSNPSGFLSYNREQFIKSFNNILKYSRLIPPYQESPFDTDNSTYTTPSIKLIAKIIKYFLYFKSKSQTIWNSDGSDNIWVIKPANNSRGNGIFLHNDCFEIINNSQGCNRIVQKYIQTPLICTNPSYPLILNKKFDIRQWVLVTSWNPLKCYMFSSCYLRICSQNYDNKDIKNLQKHLTNYSFNKDKFMKKQESVQSLQNLKKYLSAQHEVDWDIAIKPQIITIIQNTLITCSDSIVDNNDRFQMYGFDILIDSDFKPWLLQVNLSPACQQRTDFVKQYCEVMGEQLLRTILPISYCADSHLNQNQSKYFWQKIPIYYEEKKKQQLEVVGSKINIKHEKYIDRNYNQNQAAIKIQSIFKILIPKKIKRQLKKEMLSKQLQRYFRFIQSRVRFSNILTQQSLPIIQISTNSFLTYKCYEGKLRSYHINNTLSKYINAIQPFLKFKTKRLHQSIKCVQSIYDHYKCINIIVQHKHSDSVVRKIQRWYTKFYERKVWAANIIKGFMRRKLYEKKRKQFLYDLQVYSNTLKIQLYFRSLICVSTTQTRIQNRKRDIIKNSIRQMLDSKYYVKKKLQIFEREIGRVLRVTTRRTRTYYFPDIKQYVRTKMKFYLQLQKYIGVYYNLNLMKKKKYKKKSTLLLSYFKGFLRQAKYLKKVSQSYLKADSNSFQELKPETQMHSVTQNRENNKNKVLLNNIQHPPKSQIRIVGIRRAEDEDKFFNYLARARQMRGRSSRNSKKKQSMF